MRFRFSMLGLTGAVLGLGLPLLSPVTATGAPPAGFPTLIGLQAHHVGSVDRVTFKFANGLPPDVLVSWVETMHHDGSGLPVRVAGSKVLMIVFTSSTAHDHDGATVPPRTAYVLPNVITSVAGGDFEGIVTFGLGVQKQTSYTVTKLHNPDRVVIDVDAGFPTTTRNVWLVDKHAVATGKGPFFVQRPRPIRDDAPAGAALHALFAGPTPQEKAAGLRLVRSQAWGFGDLAISGGTARVRLTRGCDSGGSTVTVAGEIAPTLRQFPSVDWVKIYGPGGGTEQPQGQVDSIPACLEP